MSTDKSVKDLIEEHGKEARDRWREVFDETRARGADNDQAAKIADDVIRLEAERRVLVPCANAALGRRARSLVEVIAHHTSRDGKSIEPAWIESIATTARELARDIGS